MLKLLSTDATKYLIILPFWYFIKTLHLFTTQLDFLTDLPLGADNAIKSMYGFPQTKEAGRLVYTAITAAWTQLFWISG